MPDYPPTLNIPASKSFRALQEVKVTLRFDTPKEFEGKYGPQFKYSVDVDGVEHTLFASPALHRLIQEHNPGKGTVLSIARVGEGKETKWDVVYVSGPQAPAGAAGSPGRPPESGAGTRTPQPNPSTFLDDLALYWQSFDLAMDTLKGKGVTPSVDANAVAFVIYKLAKDHGIADPFNPTAGVPSQTEKAEENGKNKMRAELEAMFRMTRLPQEKWLEAMNAHVPEGGNWIDTWDQVTRDVGLAVYATAKNVQADLTTWDAVLGVSPGNDDEQDELPF